MLNKAWKYEKAKSINVILLTVTITNIILLERNLILFLYIVQLIYNVKLITFSNVYVTEQHYVSRFFTRLWSVRKPMLFWYMCRNYSNIYILTYLANWARTVDQPAYIPVGQLAQRLVQDWENCWRKMVSMLWYWSSWKSSLMVHQMVEYLPKPDVRWKEEIY